MYRNEHLSLSFVHLHQSWWLEIMYKKMNSFLSKKMESSSRFPFLIHLCFHVSYIFFTFLIVHFLSQFTHAICGTSFRNQFSMKQSRRNVFLAVSIIFANCSLALTSCLIYTQFVEESNFKACHHRNLSKTNAHRT